MKARKEQIITHKTRRYQQDMSNDLETESMNESKIIIPKNITIEAAIKFFEENAKDEYSVLYARTATWLKMLFTSDILKNHLTSGNDAVKEFMKNRADMQFKKDLKNETKDV